MKYWRVNTDKNAREDINTYDLWYYHNMVFTGDYSGERLKHVGVLKKMQPGDGVFMHHSGKGVVGYGIVSEPWNGKIYQGNERLLYREEAYEYRIKVNWLPKYDRRENSVPINGLLPYMGTYSDVDPENWDIDAVLMKLAKGIF